MKIKQVPWGRGKVRPWGVAHFHLLIVQCLHFVRINIDVFADYVQFSMALPKMMNLKMTLVQNLKMTLAQNDEF